MLYNNLQKSNFKIKIITIITLSIIFLTVLCLPQNASAKTKYSKYAFYDWGTYNYSKMKNGKKYIIQLEIDKLSKNHIKGEFEIFPYKSTVKTIKFNSKINIKKNKCHFTIRHKNGSRTTIYLKLKKITPVTLRLYDNYLKDYYDQPTWKGIYIKVKSNKTFFKDLNLNKEYKTLYVMAG